MIDSEPAQRVDACKEGFIGGLITGDQDLGVGRHVAKEVVDLGDVGVEGRRAVLMLLAPVLMSKEESALPVWQRNSGSERTKKSPRRM